VILAHSCGGTGDVSSDWSLFVISGQSSKNVKSNNCIKMQVFWGIKLCLRMSCYGLYCLHLQGERVQEGRLLKETKVSYIFMDDGDCFSTENVTEVPGENVYFCKCT